MNKFIWNASLLMKCRSTLILLLFVSPLHADEKSAALTLLLGNSGANLIIEEFVEEIALEQVKSRITSSGKGGLSDVEKSLYLASFSLKYMNEEVHRAFMQAFSLAEINALILFFDDVTIKKMLVADKHFGRSDGTISSKDYLRSIVNNPPSKKRILLIRELVDVSLYVEQKVYLSALITFEKNKTPKEYYGKYGEEEAQKLEHFIENYKQNMVDSIRPEMRMVFMRMYDAFTDNEIELLIDLMKEKHRLRYQSVLVDALAKVMSEGIRRGITAILEHREKPPL